MYNIIRNLLKHFKTSKMDGFDQKRQILCPILSRVATPSKKSPPNKEGNGMISLKLHKMFVFLDQKLALIIRQSI